MAMDMYSNTLVASQIFIANKIDQPYFRLRYIYTYNTYACMYKWVDLDAQSWTITIYTFLYVRVYRQKKKRILGIFSIVLRTQFLDEKK
jgi:hypothetical protein